MYGYVRNVKKLNIILYIYSDCSRSEHTALPQSLEYHQAHKKNCNVQCNHYNKAHDHLKAHFNLSQQTHTHWKLMIATDSADSSSVTKNSSHVSKDHNHSLIPLSDSAISTSLIHQHIACLNKFHCQTLTLALFFSQFCLVGRNKEALCGSGVALIEPAGVNSFTITELDLGGIMAQHFWLKEINKTCQRIKSVLYWYEQLWVYYCLKNTLWFADGT